MNNPEMPQGGSEAEPSLNNSGINIEQAEQQEALVVHGLEDLCEDLEGIDLDKMSPEDGEVLKARANRLIELLGGLSGMGIGVLEAASSVIGFDDSPGKIIASIVFTISGGIALIKWNRERVVRNKSRAPNRS